MLTKDSILSLIREETGCSKDVAVSLYNALFSKFKDVLDAGGTVKLPGVGILDTKDIEGRSYCTPGGTVYKPKRKQYRINCDPFIPA